MICLSTPRGKRGFFYRAWASGGADWQRIEVPAAKIPRIQPEFLERERRGMRDATFRQEYCCSFEVVEDLVYPDLSGCVVAGPAPASFKKREGGIDFGFRNPFAAVWGGLDGDGVLWLTHEHYVRQQPLSYHAARMPREVMWYCDPHGAAERSELRVADFKVNPGLAPVRPGIAAVQARIQSGALKILQGACPNLLEEAGLYRYDDTPQEKWDENPIGEYDHALDALRYLITRLDQRRQARPTAPDSPLVPDSAPPEKPARKKPKPWCRYDNDELWTPL
jgi:hypothetical protein